MTSTELSTPRTRSGSVVGLGTESGVNAHGSIYIVLDCEKYVPSIGPSDFGYVLTFVQPLYIFVAMVPPYLRPIPSGSFASSTFLLNSILRSEEVEQRCAKLQPVLQP